MRDPKQSSTETVTVSVGRVRFSQENCSIFSATKDVPEGELLADLDYPFPIKMFQGPVRTGQRWVVIGGWKDDEKWGRQFVGNFATLAVPRTFEELAAFLTSGLVEGWDWASFMRLGNAFGESACTVIAEEPRRLIDEAGITDEQLEALTEMWDRGAGLAPIYAELTEWGIGSALAERLVKCYRFSVLDEIRENPYQPIQEVSYYTWKVAESVAAFLEIEADDPRRIEAGVAEVIRSGALEFGHTWMPYDAAVAGARELLGLDADRIAAILSAVEVAMEDAEESAVLVRAGEHLYPGNLWWAEQHIGAQIARRMEQRLALDPAVVEALEPDPILSEEQWTAVVMALTNTVSVLTGGPGVGKTSSIKALVVAAQTLGLAVTLMAPTGKAAQRMQQAAQWPASTIHRKLKLTPGQMRVGDMVVPLTGLVVVDEVSMLDVVTASALFSGIAPAAHILLVGDPDQLPSVGPGAVLRDILTSDVLTRVHLTRVFRNDAGIAINAAHIRNGEHIQSLPDCRIMQAPKPEDAQRTVISLLTDELPKIGFTEDDALILCPTNDGESGRHALNTRLQALYNGRQAGHGITQKMDSNSYELRPNDRVIVTKNNSDLGVFNGETGRVTSIVSPKKLLADIEGREVEFAGADIKTLQLAYAITGHKAQGSEAPVVIIPVFWSRVLSREWLYTVITRARKRVYLVGDPGAIQNCIRTVRISERRTGLVDALQQMVGNTAPAQRSRSPYAWVTGSQVIHMRRRATPWRTLCGFDTRDDEWQHVPTVQVRPCLRCTASVGAVLKPFAEARESYEEAV